MNKLIRSIHPEIRVLSEAEHLVEYVASDETLDSYGEKILAKGWRFSHFQKNAPFVDSHNYGCIDRLLGKVVDFKVSGGKLIERVQWAADVESNKLAKLGWDLTEKGFLKAVSVGFFPAKWASKWGSSEGAPNLQQVLADMKVPADEAGKVNAVYLEQEQIELSACIIGANPNALAKAHRDGAVTDEQLAGVGFDDNDLQFLQDAATVFADANPAQRVLIRRELSGIPFRTNRKQQTATPADGLDAAGEAERRELDAFIREFNAVKTSITDHV